MARYAPNKVHFSREMDHELKELYLKQGKFCPEIGKIMGLTVDVLRRRLRELEIEVRAYHKGMAGKKQPESFSQKMSKVHSGKIVSLETRLKMSAANSGKWNKEKNPAWRGGITKKRDEILQSLEYRVWRWSVFLRDNFTCQVCKARSTKGVRVILNAHHIKPRSLFPNLSFDVNNGQTLCLPCHKKTDTYGAKVRHNSWQQYSA